MFGRLYGVLLPFFASFLLAWLLDPLVTFVQQKCKVKFRTLSVAITLVVFVGLLVLCFYLLVPAIGREVKSAAVAVERYFENFDPDRYFSAETQQKIQEAMNGLNLESLLSYPEVRDGIKNFLPQLGTWITGGLSWLSELLVIFIGLLYLIFLLIAFPSIRANWRYYVPKKHLRQVSTIVHELNVNMNAYFRGQALVALCVGILFAIGCAIYGAEDLRVCDGTDYRRSQSGPLYAGIGYSAVYHPLSRAISTDRSTGMADLAADDDCIHRRTDVSGYVPYAEDYG